MSAAFSAIITTGDIGVARHQRRHDRAVDHAQPGTPRTRSRVSTTPIGSSAGAILQVPLG